MAMILEERIQKYEHYKLSFSDMSREMILGTLETTLALQKNYERYSDLGLLEWEELSYNRGLTNALSKAAIETLQERNLMDRTLCKLWKSYHNDMWLFLEEPLAIKDEIHKQFEKVFGNIAAKNYGLKALLVLLSNHNWHGVPESNTKEYQRWSDERNQLETLSDQLRRATLALEVDALWDYYAPGYLDQKPTFKWLMSDELFKAVETNENYDLYMLDQILAGNVIPDDVELDDIYNEERIEITEDHSFMNEAPDINTDGDDYELQMLMDIE